MAEEKGQAAAADATDTTATIKAPKKMLMYEEMEQDENVAKGCVKVTEIIAYDVVGKKKDEDGKETIVEKGRRPYFCQTKEQENVFTENNPGIRTETFGVQLLKSTAIKKLNDPENMKQFKKE